MLLGLAVLGSIFGGSIYFITRRIPPIAPSLPAAVQQPTETQSKVTSNPTHTWYKAEYCDPQLGGCMLYACPVSDVSPATLYQNNTVYGGAKIIDSGTGRVDVITQGAQTVFFAAADSCRQFTASQKAAAAAQQQADQNSLAPYQ
jgi:hypothetical protein